MKRKEIIISLIGILIFIASLLYIQEVVEPKYINETLEGSLIDDYYNSEKDHSVLFIGDCEVYENFSPITLWEEYGITSYIRGSAQQLIWQSYYLLEETLRYEKPDVVVFNVLAMKYDKPQKEEYNRMTLDGMKFSMSKLKSILASMREEESIIDYIFPLLRYHSRWSDLEVEDFTYALNDNDVSHNGYLMRVDSKAVTSFREGKELADYNFGENSYKYLDMITKLCKDNDIELVLVKAPTIWPYWYDEWDEQIINYSEENDLMYINFLDYIEEVGIDFQKDTYDGGLHLNTSGAEKVSSYFGKILVDNFNLKDYRNNKEISKVYEEKVKVYEDMKEDQYDELAKYGYLKSYGGRKIKN